MRRHLIAPLAAAILTGAACATSPEATVAAGSAGRGNAAPVPVTAAVVEEKSVPIELNSIGTVIAASTVQVRSQITGEITSVSFNEGDEVAEGQVLLTLDRRPLDAALKQAEAALERDLIQAANAKSQAARYRNLADRGIATKEQADQWTTTAATLDATVAADRAAIETAKVNLQYATIYSPIAGRTGLLQVHPGNLVRAQDTNAIVTINKIQPVYVSFALPEAQLPEFKRYMSHGHLRIAAQPPNDPAAPSIGRVTFIDNAVDPTTGTIKAKGTFPNEDRRLWPGQFVNVTVRLTDDPHALVVPSTAVQTGQQGPYVFVINKDQAVELRSVTPVRTRGDQTVLKGGVTAGERIVTDGQLRLVPGSKVSIKNPGGPKAAS